MDTDTSQKNFEEKFPRTLVVDLSDNFGGANARILALMRNMPQNSIGLATIDGSMIARELEEAGYLVHRVAKRKFDPRIPFRMAEIIRRYGYRVVDTQNPQSKLWGSFSAFMGKAALVSTLNSWYMNEHPKYSLRWFLYSAIEILTNVVLSRYIVVSQEIRSAIIALGISGSKVDLIYNAINLDAMSIPDDKQNLKQKFHFPDDAILCVAAGRLVWAKGHDELIRAFEILVKENDRLCCVIAGDGDLRENLETQIKDAGLTENFVLSGHLSREEVLSLVKAADVFVMPSRTEGTPVAILEAAALQKPILATSVGGIPELIKDGEDGVLVPSGDVQALADGLRRLINDAVFAQRLATSAHRKVSNQFVLKTQVQSTIQSYNKAWQSNQQK